MKNTNFYINEEDNEKLANTYQYLKENQKIINLSPQARN